MRVLVALLLVFSTQAVASDVMGLMQGYEWEVPSEPLSIANAEQALIEISSDPGQPNFIRAPASAALTLYPSVRVWNFFVGQVASPSTKVSLRRTVDGPCATFVAIKAADVQKLLMPFLSNEDPHLRVRVAKCLQQIDSEEAQTALSAYRSGIGEGWEFDASVLSR
tara:strand:+ start:962 stop:1459 length:498 start_codon:yes stop_codon:yes gene_type:complete